MGALEILVVILSIFLAIFLFGAIVLVVLLIKVTKQIKRVTSTAERTANGVEKVVMGVSKASGPLMLTRIMRDLFNKSRKK